MHRLVLYFAALAIASSALAQDASLLHYEGADRVQKVLPAAKKEGSFMLYTSFAEKDLPRLTAAFEKRYGIKVKVWRSASEKVLQRSVIETAAGRHEFDDIALAQRRTMVLMSRRGPLLESRLLCSTDSRP